MEIGDTSAFYKHSIQENLVIAGPNYVYGPYDTYHLQRGLKDTYTYPVDDWYWFDSEEEAYNFFGLEWYPEVYTMGLLKPWLNNENTVTE